MSSSPFTRNYTDHSNDSGYQFEFFCDKCGNGHRSSFKTSSLGFAASMLKAAGSVFGGSLGQAGWGADHVKDALRGPAWDSAYRDAVEAARPKFRQCTRCGHWVCPEVCWNAKRGLCEDCAPDLGEQAAAAQAQIAVEQVLEKSREQDQLRGFNVSAEARVNASCAKCQATLAEGAKFCAECGTPAPVAAAAGPKFCPGCGGALSPGAKFCPGCGGRI